MKDPNKMNILELLEHLKSDSSLEEYHHLEIKTEGIDSMEVVVRGNCSWPRIYIRDDEDDIIMYLSEAKQVYLIFKQLFEGVELPEDK